MSSLRQISSLLAERAGKQTDITFIKEMRDLAVAKSALFIGRTLDKNPSKDKFYIKAFTVKLEKIDITDECSKDEPECCDQAFKSILPIPEPIKYGVHLFNYVGAPGGNKAYNWTTFGNENTLKHRPLTGKFERYTYINDHLYIFNKEIEEIRVEMVAADPRKLSKFMCCDDCTTSCYREEQDFFVDEQIAALIIDEIMTSTLRLSIPNEKIQIKEDHAV